MLKNGVMKNARFIIFFVILFAALACGDSNRTISVKRINLIGEELKVNAMLNPMIIYVSDSYLFILRSWLAEHGEKCVDILDLDSLFYLTQTAWLGRGPGEIVNPSTIVIESRNNYFWINDWGKQKCFKFSIDSILMNPNYLPKESFKFDKSLIPMMNMFYYKDGRFGFSSFNLQKSFFSFIDKRGNIIDNFSVPNKIYSDISDEMGYGDNPLTMNYNSEKDKFVIASRYNNKLAVIDIDGNPDFKLDEMEIENDTDEKNTKGFNFISFYQIASDNDYIYCLFKGGNVQGYNTVLQSPEVYYPDRILVFDWSGNICYDIKLDHTLISFALDSKHNRIIGVTPDFENGIVLYDISQLLKASKNDHEIS